MFLIIKEWFQKEILSQAISGVKNFEAVAIGVYLAFKNIMVVIALKITVYQILKTGWKGKYKKLWPVSLAQFLR